MVEPSRYEETCQALETLLRECRDPRTGEPAVVGRLRDGRLLLAVRTAFPRQEDGLVEALRVAGGRGC